MSSGVPPVALRISAVTKPVSREATDVGGDLAGVLLTAAALALLIRPEARVS